MAGLDPSKSDLQGMNVLEDAYKYLGVDNSLKEAIEATMGKLRQFKDVVLADESTWMADVQALKVIQVAAIPEAAEVGTAGQPGHVPARPRQPAKDRRLNTLESGQVGALRRISRLRLNLPAAEEVAPTGMGAGSGASSQAQQASPAPQAIVATLISEVIDQSDHTPVTPWKMGTVRAAMKVFEQGNKGQKCADGDEPSPLQFAALEYKLKVCASLYCDFGVWRRNSGRMERRIRLTIHHRNEKGEWIPYEIQGPSSFAEWQEGWRVFCVAMRALDKADQPVLDLYERKLQKLLKDWGIHCWWIVAQADCRMRSEKITRLLWTETDIMEADAAKGLVPDMDKARPWNHLIKIAAQDDQFWQEEVKEPAIRWLSRLESKESIQNEGFGEVRAGHSGLQLGPAAANLDREPRGRKRRAEDDDSSSGGKVMKKKRNKGMKRKEEFGGKGARLKAMPANPKGGDKGKGKGKGGKPWVHKQTAAGKEICFTFARNGGCSSPCPASRAHVCEYCLLQHHNNQCKSR